MPKRRNSPYNPPALVFDEIVLHKISQGVDMLVNAISPTLGPHPRSVAFHEPLTGEIELLDNGGIIARRIVELNDRGADVGAMFLRQVLWELHEDVGDGTATAAVIFQSVFKQGLHYLTAGGNAQLLRRELESGLKLILGHLDAQAIAVKSHEQLYSLARSASHDEELAQQFSEIFEVLGEYGRLELRKGQRRESHIAYQAGSYWNRGAVTQEAVEKTHSQQVMLDDVAILISDLSITEPHHLIPAIGAALTRGATALIVIANQFDARVLGMLHANQQQSKISVYAVHTPEIGAEQYDSLEDLTHLTGGKAFISAAQDTLRHVSPDNLGYARTAWVDAHTFGVLGGAGDPCKLQAHITRLEKLARRETGASRRKLSRRIGNLLGGTTTLWLGGSTQQDIETRKSIAERTEKSIRAALAEGVIPGGGASLITCQGLLRAMQSETQQDERRAAAHILHQAMEAPLRTILTNAGFEPAQALAELRLQPDFIGFDVERGVPFTRYEYAVIDPIPIQKAAVVAAVRSAALALTIDTIVHHREREVVYQP